MSAEMWSAILNPRGPNYQTWRETLGGERVPLRSCASVKATLGEEKDVEVYMLDLAAMALNCRARLVGHIAAKFNAPIYEVEAEIAKVGFPIRAADVIVSYDPRAFV